MNTTSRDSDKSRRLAVQTVAAGRNFEVVMTHWSRELHPHRSEDCPAYGAIEFMRAGMFRKRSDRGETICDPNSVVFFRPYESFTVEHPIGAENRGTTVRLSADRFQEIWEHPTRRRNQEPTPPLRANCSARCFADLLALLADLRADCLFDPVEVEERVMTLVAALLACARPHAPVRATRRHIPRLAGGRGRVLDVIEYMNDACSQRLTLDQLSRVAECSSWHLSRLFKTVLDVPVHQYLRRLRLRRAITLMAEGCNDLTNVAIQSGFCDHSHFSASFRREFGSTPRDMRQLFKKPR